MQKAAVKGSCSEDSVLDRVPESKSEGMPLRPEDSRDMKGTMSEKLRENYQIRARIGEADDGRFARTVED